jgi:6-phospho-beta-glucosidase
MKLAVVGGGGFRVPLVYQALLPRADRLALDELVLYDLDAGRLARVARVLEGLAAERGDRLPFRTTTKLDDALEGADFVFAAIRPGGLAGRVVDEAVPLELGVLGQETTGPGGICFALRTIPPMLALAEAMAARAPDAWLINFTNPAGMVTEAVRTVLGDQVVGVCDSPSGLCRRVARALRRRRDELWFDYFGLNHLGWLAGVRDGRRDLLPGLLADDAALAGLEAARLFGADWLRTLGMIPNEYLYYFYFTAEAIAGLSAGESRGARLAGAQAAFYAGDGFAAAGVGDALAAWRATRAERERTYMAEAGVERDEDDGGGYEGEAMAVVEAIAGDSQAVLILNTANRGALGCLDDAAVVEVPCVVGATGAHPLAAGALPAHAEGLIRTIKDVERATISAALSGSTREAVKALALHPLVPSVATARAIFAGYRDRMPELAERLS